MIQKFQLEVGRFNLIICLCVCVWGGGGGKIGAKTECVCVG